MRWILMNYRVPTIIIILIEYLLSILTATCASLTR